jgi:hypothetical protein
MRFKASALITCAILAGTVQVQAATLTPNGIVLLNRGNGFERVNSPTDCHPTDRVLVSDGSAQIAYRNGSLVGLHPGQLYTVGDPDRDDAGALVNPHGAHGAYGAAGGGAVGAAGASAGIGGISTTALVVGGIAAAAGVATLAARAAKPSSP